MIAEYSDVEKLPANLSRELLDIVDHFLSDISNQKLVDSERVQDFCLDIRLLITANTLEEDSNVEDE